MELTAIGFTEIAWVALAAGLAGIWIVHIKSRRQDKLLKARVDRISRSIGLMVDWADDVDTRLAILEAARDVRNDNSSTRPFLESVTAKDHSTERSHLSSERVHTIITNLRRMRLKPMRIMI